jgi:mono/diheme cytochrome c family protein
VWIKFALTPCNINFYGIFEMKHFNPNQSTPIRGKLITFCQSNFLKIGLLASTVAVLTACGGGGTGNGTGSTVSGVAATGMAIADGQVSLKCAVGSAGPTTTQADGSFSIDVSKVTLPCLARVDYVDSAGAKKKLHSVVPSAGNVNITPLTDMVVANLSANGIAASAYDTLDASQAQGFTSERIKTATQVVKTKLSSIVVDVTHLPDDVIGTKLIAATASRKGDSHDHVLDDLQSKLHEHGKTLEDIETEMSAGHETRGFSTSTGSPGNAQAGKAMYEANCLSCHGPRMPDAVNSSKIIKAIRQNEGGMGSLAGVINVVAADDIATFMAYGFTGGTVPPLKTQTIDFASPGNQTIGSATPVLLATSNSGLAVSITSDTPAVCTVSGSTLVLLASGTCSLSANQSGDTTYNAAVTVTNAFTVAPSSGVIPTAQTITFVSPGPQTVGTTVSLNASASSGLPVALDSTTPSVCTVTGNVLTPLTVGDCIVTANQSGNTNFAAAPMVSLTLSVTSPTPVTSAINGKALYASNSCGNCHGTPPAFSKVLNGANNPTVIQNAITNIGGMNKYANLTTQNLADIAAYLATPNI